MKKKKTLKKARTARSVKAAPVSVKQPELLKIKSTRIIDGDKFNVQLSNGDFLDNVVDIGYSQAYDGAVVTLKLYLKRSTPISKPA